MIVFRLSCVWFFIIEFFSQQSNLNFRWCEKELSEFRVLSFCYSDLTNMINSNTALLFEVLNQEFILSLDFIRRGMNVVNNFFISESFKFIFSGYSLIELIENIFKAFFNIINHFVSFFDRLFSTFLGFLVEIFIFDNFLEDSFIRWELIFLLCVFVTFESGSKFIQLIFIFFEFSLSSKNFQSRFVLNLLLINCQEGFCSIPNS